MILIRIALVAGLVVAAVAAGKSTLDIIDVSPAKLADTVGAAPEVETLRPAVPALADMIETRERPLLAATRRPGSEIEAVLPEESSRRLALVGLMRPEGREGRALIRIEGVNAATWVAPGAQIEGYVVREIVRDGVGLERDGRRLTLRLRPTRTAQD